MHFRSLLSLVSLALFLGSILPAHAQEGPQRRLRPRKLAPGVLTVIPPEKDEGETFSGPRPLVEVTEGIDPAILNWTPNYSPQSETLKAKALATVFRRRVWYLEFSFKPLRMIEIDIPQANGKMQRTSVWYMVYRIKNNGYHLNPKQGRFVFEGDRKVPKWVKDADEFGHTMWGVDRVNHTVRFFPKFVLEAREFETPKRYMDQLIPVAIPQIQRREDPAIKLYDSVSVSTVDIPVSTERIDRSIWGVVTWVDINPHVDFFSVYIQGLTNAYRFADPEGAFKVGDPPLTGRRFQTKTLQLCFWRPGDAVLEHEKEIRYGMPAVDTESERERMLKLYNVPERVDYRWLYQ